MVKHTIDHYISNLLYYNECVVVPGFGAFLTRYYPAEINSATHMFRPPSKRVAFNTRIQENDGLLAKHITSVDHVSYEKALESIDISVRSWKKLLRAGKKVNLNGIGRLYMSDMGKLQFNPAHDINYDINSYGLNIFRANAMDRDLEIKRSVNKAIEKHQVKKGKKLESKSEEPVVRDINYRRWVGLLGPVAAMLLVGAYLYVNPGTVNTVQQQVSGIFLNDTSFKLEQNDEPSQLTASESVIGFNDGERLNGDFGPEDDVVSETALDYSTETENSTAVESPTENEIAQEQQEGNPEIEAILNDTNPAGATASEFEEELNATSTDNAVVSSNTGELERDFNKNKASAKEMIADNFFIPEKPLYQVKERPNGYEDQSSDYDTYNTYTSAASLSSSSKTEAPKKKVVEADKNFEQKVSTKPVSSPIQAKQEKASLNKPKQITEAISTRQQYQVVVGAFSSEANAQRYAKQLSAQGWVAYSYAAGNMHRVAIGKLGAREQASQLLTRVRQEVNAQAWVNLQ